MRAKKKKTLPAIASEKQLLLFIINIVTIVITIITIMITVVSK